MPSHQERVRRNYACPDCSGTGTIDDYEGQYPCSECNGSGIVLTERKPPTRSVPFVGMEWICRDTVEVLKRRLAVANTLTKSL